MDGGNNQIGSSLIDNFEASFTSCIHSFTKQESAIDVDKGKNFISVIFFIEIIANEK